MLGILALLIAAVGWYYLFYSRAAQRLVGIAAGTYRFKPDTTPREWVITWSTVMLLLPTSLMLALIDVRLTMKLRQRLRERQK